MQPISFQPINAINQGQVNQAQNVYNANQAGAAGANQNLQSYQQSLAQPQNQLGNIYGQNVQNTEQQMGFDPAKIAQANQALAATQSTMANLPSAIQQAANGRMVTGAQEANRYAQAASNVNNTLAGQGNALNALQSTYQNVLNQAGQQTTFTGQSQQQQLGALQNEFQNAQAQYTTAQTQLSSLQSLYESQGQFNASQQAAYETANANMVSAQAAMKNADAAMGQLQLAQNAATAASTAQAAKVKAAQQPAVVNYGENAAPNYGGSILSSLPSAIGNLLTPVTQPFENAGYALGSL